MSIFYPSISVRDSSSSWKYELVTPSDTTSFTSPVRGLFVGGAGDVAVVGLDGTSVTFTGVVAGSILPVICTRVNSTNTTANNIIALY